MQEFIDLAHRMADEAGAIARRYFRADFTIEHKADETPVTIADRTIEEKLRAIIEQARPDDGILGEEFGVKESKNGYVWVLDPIDGTKAFTIGRPTFGTLIALCKDDVPILGIIDQPILRDRWVGVTGQPTTLNNKAVQSARCPTLSKARIASNSPDQINGGTPPLWQRLQEKGFFVTWGGDCTSYGLLSAGWVDMVVESKLAPYDYLSMVPIVEGAGGWIGDWQGQPPTLKSDGHILALGNPALKDEVLEILK